MARLGVQNARGYKPVHVSVWRHDPKTSTYWRAMIVRLRRPPTKEWTWATDERGELENIDSRSLEQLSTKAKLATFARQNVKTSEELVDGTAALELTTTQVYALETLTNFYETMHTNKRWYDTESALARDGGIPLWPLGGEQKPKSRVQRNEPQPPPLSATRLRQAESFAHIDYAAVVSAIIDCTNARGVEYCLEAFVIDHTYRALPALRRQIVAANRESLDDAILYCDSLRPPCEAMMKSLCHRHGTFRKMVAGYYAADTFSTGSLVSDYVDAYCLSRFKCTPEIELLLKNQRQQIVHLSSSFGSLWTLCANEVTRLQGVSRINYYELSKFLCSDVCGYEPRCNLLLFGLENPTSSFRAGYGSKTKLRHYLLKLRIMPPDTAVALLAYDRMLLAIARAVDETQRLVLAFDFVIFVQNNVTDLIQQLKGILNYKLTSLQNDAELSAQDVLDVRSVIQSVLMGNFTPFNAPFSLCDNYGALTDYLRDNEHGVDARVVIDCIQFIRTHCDDFAHGMRLLRARQSNGEPDIVEQFRSVLQVISNLGIRSVFTISKRALIIVEHHLGRAYPDSESSLFYLWHAHRHQFDEIGLFSQPAWLTQPFKVKRVAIVLLLDQIPAHRRSRMSSDILVLRYMLFGFSNSIGRDHAYDIECILDEYESASGDKFQICEHIKTWCDWFTTSNVGTQLPPFVYTSALDECLAEIDYIGLLNLFTRERVSAASELVRAALQPAHELEEFSLGLLLAYAAGRRCTTMRSALLAACARRQDFYLTAAHQLVRKLENEAGSNATEFRDRIPAVLAEARKFIGSTYDIEFRYEALRHVGHVQLNEAQWKSLRAHSLPSNLCVLGELVSAGAIGFETHYRCAQHLAGKWAHETREATVVGDYEMPHVESMDRESDSELAFIDDEETVVAIVSQAGNAIADAAAVQQFAVRSSDLESTYGVRAEEAGTSSYTLATRNSSQMAAFHDWVSWLPTVYDHFAQRDIDDDDDESSLPPPLENDDGDLIERNTAESIRATQEADLNSARLAELISAHLSEVNSTRFAALISEFPRPDVGATSVRPTLTYADPDFEATLNADSRRIVFMSNSHLDTTNHERRWVFTRPVLEHMSSLQLPSVPNRDTVHHIRPRIVPSHFITNEISGQNSTDEDYVDDTIFD